MIPKTVTFRQEENIGVITLNRPHVHNAVDETVMEGLEAILDEVETDGELRALILTGAGTESFCAGGDLRYFTTLNTHLAVDAMSRRMQTILQQLENSEIPVIAAVNGRALGGGCELLTACHYRIASPRAEFSFRQAANGIITGWGGGRRLFRLLKRGDALCLLLTSETIDAAEARRIGLVDQVARDNDPLPAALQFAGKIAANPRAPVTAFLRLIRGFDNQQGEELAGMETGLFCDLWLGDDFREWLRNFTENSAGKRRKD